MSKLKARDPQAAEPSKPKILVYGAPGAGKTWTALDFPACYYIDTEGGADLPHYIDRLKKSGGKYLGPEDGALEFETVIEQVQALATEEHAFRTLVIDSISKLFNVAISNEAERLLAHGKKNEFGADKKPAVGYMRRLANWIVRLPMNVVFIAHEKAEWGTDAKGDRVEIGKTFDCWDKLEYELHLCLHVQRRGKSRTARIRKTRLTGFEDGTEFPWSFDEFAERYGRDVILAKADPIALATPEEVFEIKRLVDAVKLEEGTVEKWFTRAGVTSFEEMESDTVQKCIAHLHKQVGAPRLAAA